MNWSVDKRFSRGIFLTPELLGYDRDKNGNLVVNPDEAETVKVIYALYLNGKSFKEIADLLTRYGRKTKLGKEMWNPSVLRKIIGNERHCGDVLARKTYTPNFKNHKSKKNKGNRTQYLQKNHHEPIVTREVFTAANHLKSSRTYSSRNKPLPILSVIDYGILRGYVPIDKDWNGFSAEEYQHASESAYDGFVPKKPEGKKLSNSNEILLNMQGYQVIRGTYSNSISYPALTIWHDKLRFNIACLRKFQNVEYVELLFNTVKKTIAIRPCEKDKLNAIHWGRLRENCWCVCDIGCKGFTRALFSIMKWDNDTKYRFRGQLLNSKNERLLLFELNEPEMTKYIERVLPIPALKGTENSEVNKYQERTEEIVVKEQIRIMPPSWTESFGLPITSIAPMKILEQVKIDNEWDIFRPAKEIAELNLFRADELYSLEKEAEIIMERWEENGGRAE